MLPPLAKYLDPRPSRVAQDKPITDAVNIALDELPSRMHELPPRHGQVLVAGPEPAEALRFLEESGRTAIAATDWEYGVGVPGRLWEPSSFMMEGLPLLTPGHALDLACGSGRDAVALAAYGWTVTAIDVLEDALQKGRDLARRYLPPYAASRIEWRTSDLESGTLPLLPECDLAIMFWYLNRSLIAAIPQLLRPHGSLLLESFTAFHRRNFGKPRTEAFVFESGEISRLVPDLDVRRYVEGWHNGRHSARFWAEKGLG